MRRDCVMGNMDMGMKIEDADEDRCFLLDYDYE